MKLSNAMNEYYEENTVLGQQALFTSVRLDRKTVPEGLFVYDVRHDDECQGIPCEIANKVLVNHWGTIVTAKPIDFHGNNYIFLKEGDFNYVTGECNTIEKFIRKYLLIDVDKLIEYGPQEVVEMCSHCMNENVFKQWNVLKQGFETVCLHCGERLMLCDECNYLSGGLCDWSSETNSCCRRLPEKCSKLK